MKKVIFALLLGLFIQTTLAQHLETDKLNTYFETLDTHHKFMGSVSVAQNGQKKYSVSTGFVDVEAQIKANGDSKYKIGSISKTFTSVLIFQAIEKGKLSLDQTLESYFPEVIHANKITIAQMLRHRSGIHNFTEAGFSEWATRPKSEKEMVEILVKGGSDFEPDSRAAYSNSNYVLLSYILEKIYKKTFSEILKAQITKPLKLKNTYFGNKSDPQKNECNSYQYFDKWRIESDTHPSVTMGAGGIVSTPDDLNTFFEALFTGKLVSHRNLEEMKTIRDGFGMGLIQFPFYDKIGYGHTGRIDGFNSVSIFFPSDSLAYSLTSNGTNYLINKVSIAVLSGVCGKPFELPDFNRTDLSTEELDRYLGVYSSGQLPLKITITKRDKTLVGQGTGQVPFDLQATSKDKFQFEEAGIILEFDPENHTLILKQGGGVFLMKKE